MQARSLLAALFSAIALLLQARCASGFGMTSRRGALSQFAKASVGLGLGVPLVSRADGLEDLSAPTAAEEEEERTRRKLEAQKAASKKGAKVSYKDSVMKEVQQKKDRASRTSKQLQQDKCEVLGRGC